MLDTFTRLARLVLKQSGEALYSSCQRTARRQWPVRTPRATRKARCNRQTLQSESLTLRAEAEQPLLLQLVERAL
jgi:hypothetical protein